MRFFASLDTCSKSSADPEDISWQISFSAK